MKAVLAESYGGPEVLRVVHDVPIPRVGPHGVLVQVHAGSVNPLDWKLRQGLLRAIRPVVFPVIWGCDCSGVVAETGSSVTLFKPGDEVFGFKDGWVSRTFRGCYAEYVVVPENALAKKPPNLTHEEAASLPLAALTAWQALLNRGKLTPGNRVLIQGGAGGVGVCAVQLAKAFGAYVAATAGGRNQEFLRELGADLPIDYEREAVEQKISGCDLVIDAVGQGVWRNSLAALKRGGRFATLVVPLPGSESGKLSFFSSVAGQVAAQALRLWSQGKRFLIVRAQPRGGDLEKIAILAEAGKIRPFIEEVFPLEEVARAHQRSEAGHVRGKIVLNVRA